MALLAFGNIYNFEAVTKQLHFLEKLGWRPFDW